MVSNQLININLFNKKEDNNNKELKITKKKSLKHQLLTHHPPIKKVECVY